MWNNRGDLWKKVRGEKVRRPLFFVFPSDTVPENFVLLASPVQGEVGGGCRSEGLFCVVKKGLRNPFAPAVNPSVSLAADSSPCTGEPLKARRMAVL